VIEALLGPLQRWLMHVGVLLIVGVVAWTGIVRPAAIAVLQTDDVGPQTPKAFQELSRGVARIGKATAILLIPVWVLSFVVQILGFRDPFVPLIEDVSFLLRETFWGKVWVVQGILLLLLSLNSGKLVHRSALGWMALVILVIALPVTLALSSHAMSETGIHRIIAVIADASHILAVGAWMGSLTLILVVGSRLGDRESLLAAQLRAFSPVALTAVPVLILMGGTLSFYHLSAIQDLWSTPYGRVLLWKLLLAGTVLIMGLINWRFGLPTLESSTGRRTVRRRAAWEVATAGIVLAFTAVLTGIPTP